MSPDDSGTFTTRTSPGARAFGVAFICMAAVLAVSGGWLLSERKLGGVLGVAMAPVLLEAANDAVAVLVIDDSGLEYRRLILPRSLQFASVEAVERRRWSRTDELIFQPRKGLALRIRPQAFERERELRAALLERVRTAGLSWP